MSTTSRVVTGGVDTHKDVHVAAALNEHGALLATASFPATGLGYDKLRRWISGFGPLGKVGVEGTGSYGAGLTRSLRAAGVEVVEVNRPNREVRRRHGKSDTVDAEAAARAVLACQAVGTPKSSSGPVEGLRALRVARRSAVKARTQAGNQIRDLIVSAPQQLRERLGRLSLDAQVARCATWRPGPGQELVHATKRSLRHLARRHRALSAEIAELDRDIADLCAEANPALLAVNGVGPEVASMLLVAAGDNPGRMRCEAAFAALCGASPVGASSGKTVRHRLNRGGNREANNALWRIAMVRLAHHHRPTEAYMRRRREQGKTDREILRCLKRYIAREIFHVLTNPDEIPLAADLRQKRLAVGISLATAAGGLGTTAMRLSRLERGVLHAADLATTYQNWLNAQVLRAA
jgi:transposase